MDSDRDMSLSSKPFTTSTSVEKDMELNSDVTSKDKTMDTNIGKSSKPNTTSSLVLPSYTGESDSLLIDRLTTLPVDLLVHILSLLPTKDAAAACVFSKRMMTQVFPCITTLDLNDSPISHCLEHPHEIESFPFFVTFVDSVLRKHKSQCLTRFRLGIATEYRAPFEDNCGHQIHVRRYGEGCLPDLNSIQINAWISFPLTYCGLRELDLCIWVRGKGDDYQLFPEIFTCETLEVLKLDTNLGFELASTKMSSFRLPKLKLFFLLAIFLPVNDFLTRLVSSCPLLEDLTVKGRWINPESISISSPSLRRMFLKLDTDYLLSESPNSNSVLINTPNLEYLDYTDTLAYQYFITKMDRLVKVNISTAAYMLNEDTFQKYLNLIRPLSNVQHLALKEDCTELLDFAGLKDQLPLFPKLKCLELIHMRHYDKLLLPFLQCSPVLETLVFPRGMVLFGHSVTHYTPYQLEREFCRTTQAIIPSCCRDHLKRIEIHRCFGYAREINLIQFLLTHALVLEELVITLYSVAGITADQILTFKSTVANLPRASKNCTILFDKTYFFDNPFPRATTG